MGDRKGQEKQHGQVPVETAGSWQSLECTLVGRILGAHAEGDINQGSPLFHLEGGGPSELSRAGSLSRSESLVLELDYTERRCGQKENLVSSNLFE